MHSYLRRGVAALAFPLAVAPVFAQDTPNVPAVAYSKPPREILDVMRAPPPPSPMLSPTHDKALMVTGQEFPSIARVATPYLKLAGVRVEPRNHARHDTLGGYGIVQCARSFSLVGIPDGRETAVDLAGTACVTHVRWSFDGVRFAFENITADSVELWIGDAKDGTVRRIPGVRLNPMLENELRWMPDQRTLIVKLVPDNLGPQPRAPEVPPGPSVQESAGQKGQSSTYETRDTLSSAHDEDLFDYFAASQLALVDAVSGGVTMIGKPDRYEQVYPAPDGRHVLVSAIRKPYSYVTTFDRFPVEVDVLDVSVQPARVARHIASLPLADRVPIRGVRTGPRNFMWRPTEPATLVWSEALDGGNPNVKAAERDKVMMMRAPFDTAPVEVLRTEQRFASLSWGERADVALLTDFDVNRRWRRTWSVDIDDPAKPRKLLWDMSADERYRNPGIPVFRALPNGTAVMRQDGDAIFLRGAGASTEGDRPFLDRFDLATGATERLFRSDKDTYETFLTFSGKDTRKLITWHQSVKDPPNLFVLTLTTPVRASPGEAAYASRRGAVTHTPDPTPAVRQIKKRLVKYKRPDGIDLSFTIYTPPGYREGTRVPTILYAYPLDYADPTVAGQITGSEHTFTRLRGRQLLLLAGYALIDNASFPIVGDPRKAYDTYLDQLVANAMAAVDEAVRLGVADPDRIGVTGHSHGALMTVNLLAHTDLFRAGVATSGSYNKTLTPFGFQNERRSVWDAQEVYLKASPFFFADKLKTPLLIVHGMDDANPGTTPIQAVELYKAVRGNGGTTRLVMLPHEPHWYTAAESNEQLVYEMLRWFDKYVKDAPPKAAKS